MTVDRMTRVNELLRREIAEAIIQLVTEDDFDSAAVSITRVDTSRSLRTAKVMVSIRDHRHDRKHLLRILTRYRAEIQARINRDLKLKYTPCLSFELDSSVERGDQVLHILLDMDEKEQAQGVNPVPGTEAEADHGNTE